MRTITSEQVNARLMAIEVGASARLLGIVAARVTAWTWRIAGDDETLLIAAGDRLLKRAGYRPFVFPVVEQEATV
jgi:hypothetical protein